MALVDEWLCMKAASSCQLAINLFSTSTAQFNTALTFNANLQIVELLFDIMIKLV
jgi:hypothetical protein